MSDRREEFLKYCSYQYSRLFNSNPTRRANVLKVPDKVENQKWFRIIDLDGTVQQWDTNYNQFPRKKILSTKECTIGLQQTLRFILSSRILISTLYEYITNAFGMVFDITCKPNDGTDEYLVLFGRTEVAVRLLHFFNQTKKHQLFDWSIPPEKKIIIVDIKPYETTNSTNVLLQFCDLKIGNLVPQHKQPTRFFVESSIYGERESQSSKFSTLLELQNLGNVRLLAEGQRHKFTLYFRVAKTDYKILIHVLHGGGVYLLLRDKEKLRPSQQVLKNSTTEPPKLTPDLTLFFMLRTCPQVYKRTDGKQQLLQDIDLGDFTSQEWIRDYTTNLNFLGFRSPYDTSSLKRHPLEALTRSWTFCVRRKHLHPKARLSFIRYLARHGLLHLRERLVINWLRVDITHEEILKFWLQVKSKRSSQLCMTLLSLMSNQVLPYNLVLNAKCRMGRILLDPELYDDDLLCSAFQSFTARFQLRMKPDPIKLFLDHLDYVRTLNIKPRYQQANYTNLFHIIITPYKIFIDGPHTEVMNRVFRDNKNIIRKFVRLCFRDEDLEPIFLQYTKNYNLIHRASLILTHGVKLLGSLFAFFGYSSSQLKMISSLFLEVEDNIKESEVEKVVSTMGDFSNQQSIAKVASRQGQCFSSTRPIEDLPEDAFTTIPDTTCDIILGSPEKGQFCFTDGVGFCTTEFMNRVRTKLDLNSIPSAMQIRFRGYKGMIAINDRWFQQDSKEFPSEQRKKFRVVFRESMKKFESSHGIFEVVSVARFTPFHFNRQILLALDTIGVPEQIFLNLQHKMIRNMSNCFRSRSAAMEFLMLLVSQNIISSLVELLLRNEINLQEPFIHEALTVLRTYSLRQLITRSWIACENACHVFGIIDESCTLRYDHGNGMPEVFLQINRKLESNEYKRLHHTSFTFNHTSSWANLGQQSLYIPTGPIMIAKCPVLYPGDIQLCYAVDQPELHEYQNVLMFPQQIPPKGTYLKDGHPNLLTNDNDRAHSEKFLYTGYRDIPNMLSGSDLDGDEYHVCWEPSIVNQLVELHKKNKIPKPAGYYIPFKPLEKEPFNSSSQNLQEMLKKYFLEYWMNDNLGQIATYHERTAHAPKVYSNGKALHPLCVELAELHSAAVDFAKTGKAAKISSRLRPTDQPHFRVSRLHPHDQTRVFYSKSLIGHLFDEARDLPGMQTEVHHVRITSIKILRRIKTLDDDNQYKLEQSQQKRHTFLNIIMDEDDNVSENADSLEERPFIPYALVQVDWRLKRGCYTHMFNSIEIIVQSMYSNKDSQLYSSHRDTVVASEVCPKNRCSIEMLLLEPPNHKPCYQFSVKCLDYKGLSLFASPFVAFSMLTEKITTSTSFLSCMYSSDIDIDLFCYGLPVSHSFDLEQLLKRLILNTIEADASTDLFLSLKKRVQLPAVSIEPSTLTSKESHHRLYMHNNNHYAVHLKTTQYVIKDLCKILQVPIVADSSDCVRKSFSVERFGMATIPKDGNGIIISTHQLSFEDVFIKNIISKMYILNITTINNQNLYAFTIYNQIRLLLVADAFLPDSNLPPAFLISFKDNEAYSNSLNANKPYDLYSNTGLILCWDNGQCERLLQRFEDYKHNFETYKNQQRFSDIQLNELLMLRDQPEDFKVNRLCEEPEEWFEKYINQSNVVDSYPPRHLSTTFHEIYCYYPTTSSFIDFCRQYHKPLEIVSYDSSPQKIVQVALKKMIETLLSVVLENDDFSHLFQPHHIFNKEWICTVDNVSLDDQYSNFNQNNNLDYNNNNNNDDEDNNSLRNVDMTQLPHINCKVIVLRSWAATLILSILGGLPLLLNERESFWSTLFTYSSSSSSNKDNENVLHNLTEQIKTFLSKALFKTNFPEIMFLNGKGLLFRSVEVMNFDEKNDNSSMLKNLDDTSYISSIEHQITKINDVVEYKNGNENNGINIPPSTLETNDKIHYSNSIIGVEYQSNTEKQENIINNAESLQRDSSKASALLIASSNLNNIDLQNSMNKDLIGPNFCLFPFKKSYVSGTVTREIDSLINNEDLKKKETLNRFTVLSNLKESNIDLDLIHKDFDEFIKPVEAIFDVYCNEINLLLNEFGRHMTEMELATGCVSVNSTRKGEKELPEKVLYAYNVKVRTIQQLLNSFSLNYLQDQQRAIASAAYILSHQRYKDYIFDDESTTEHLKYLENDKNELSEDEESNEELEDDTFEEDDWLALGKHHCLCFPWIFFSAILTSMKQECLAFKNKVYSSYEH